MDNDPNAYLNWVFTYTMYSCFTHCAVDQMKNIVTKANDDGQEPYLRLLTVFFETKMRVFPHSRCGKEPFTLDLSRRQEGQGAGSCCSSYSGHEPGLG